MSEVPLYPGIDFIGGGGSRTDKVLQVGADLESNNLCQVDECRVASVCVLITFCGPASHVPSFFARSSVQLSSDL